MSSRMIALLAGIGIAAGAHGAAHKSGEQNQARELDRQQYGAEQGMRRGEARMTDAERRARQQQEARTAQQAMNRLGVKSPDELEGKDVLNEQGEEIGEVDRVARNRATGEVVAIVGLQGIFGANMKEVPVPLAKLQRGSDDNLMTSLTKDELQTWQDADPWSEQFGDIEEGE